jgi:radical SAM superfamily enzyme with C-terminal helix-hairpin-helix motif
LLIRVERNCPWNRCRFCGVYKGRRFSRRPLEHVLRDIDAVADHIDALRAGRCGGAISVEGEGAEDRPSTTSGSGGR